MTTTTTAEKLPLIAAGHARVLCIEDESGTHQYVLPVQFIDAKLEALFAKLPTEMSLAWYKTATVDDKAAVAEAISLLRRWDGNCILTSRSGPRPTVVNGFSGWWDEPM